MSDSTQDEEVVGYAYMMRGADDCTELMDARMARHHDEFAIHAPSFMLGMIARMTEAMLASGWDEKKVKGALKYALEIGREFHEVSSRERRRGMN